jgi:HEAT repeat protein
MAQTPAFGAVTTALLEQKTALPSRYLRLFSDISPENLAALLLIWPKVTLERKLTLLEDLIELADADTLVSFDDLARALLADPEGLIRARAIRLLQECEDVKLIPSLIHILAKDDEVEARAAAAAALGWYVYKGELEEIPSTVLRSTEAALLKAAGAQEVSLVRRRALEALGYSSRPEVVSLIEAAYHQQDPDWIASALFAMGRSQDQQWGRKIVAQLHTPDESVRLEAIRASGELGLESARRSLLDLLADEEDTDLRHEIIWALSEIGGEGVRDGLQELLDTAWDEEEADFLGEALENLYFTEDLTHFDILDVDPDDAPVHPRKDDLE